MITRNSLNKLPVSYDQDTCPFCGNLRDKAWTIAGRTRYRQCECDENQRAVNNWSRMTKEVRDYTDQLEDVERRIGMYKEKSQELLRQSNLGRRFENRTFENFNTSGFNRPYKTAREYARSFEKNRGQGLLFIGTLGTGKTHLAAAITNYIIKEFGIPVQFSSFIDILDNVKQAFKTGEGVIKELLEVPLLVIDDLGKERQTEWSNSVLYQIINGRYENYLPVIITANGNLKTLEENIGQATVSRIIEMCDGIKMEGKDYRKSRLI